MYDTVLPCAMKNSELTDIYETFCVMWTKKFTSNKWLLFQIDCTRSISSFGVQFAYYVVTACEQKGGL